MKDKELEKELENSIDNIEVRDFSLVWDDIKDKVKPKKHTRRSLIMRWGTVAASFFCLLMACSIILPIVIKQNTKESDVTYFMEQLGAVSVEEKQFYEELNKEDIKHVDFSRYVGNFYVLLQTEDYKTKGGSIELSDDLENPTFLLTLQFYDDRVKGESIASPEFNLNYEVNGGIIYYRIKESYPEESWYIYELRANYNSVNYYMEYMCFTEDIKPFLDEFFK